MVINTTVSVFGAESRQKLSDYLENQTGLCGYQTKLVFVVIYKTIQTSTPEYTLFSPVNGILTNIKHLLDHKKALINLNELKSYRTYALNTTEWIQCTDDVS